MDDIHHTQSKRTRSCILTSLTDEKVYVFNSFVDADNFLKKRHGYTRGRFGSQKPVCLEHDNGVKEYFTVQASAPQKIFIQIKASIEQPCWSCGNCYGGCSWSRAFIPVIGWEAKEIKKDGHTTYEITYCPEYISDMFKRKRRKND